MTFLIIILVLSMVISQLLIQRASKERILYLTTFVASVLTLSAMMILQTLKKSRMLTTYCNRIVQ